MILSAISQINLRIRQHVNNSVVYVLLFVLSTTLSLMGCSETSEVKLAESKMDTDSLYKHGKELMIHGEHEKALQVMTEVGGYARLKGTPEDSLLATQAYNNAGVMSFFNSNYAGAFTFYKKAIEAGGDSRSYFVKTNLGIIYSLFNDYDRAEDLMFEAYREAAKAEDWHHTTVALYNLMNLEFLYDRGDSLETIIRDFRSLQIPDNETSRYISKVADGILCSIKGEQSPAIKNFRKADSLALFTRQPLRGQIDCNWFIAKAYERSRQPDSAVNYYLIASRLADTPDMRDHLPDIYNSLADNYRKLNRLSEEAKFRNRYYILKDSLSSLEQLSIIKNLEGNYQSAKYENEISVMAAERRLQRIIIIIVVCFLLVTCVLLVITFFQKKKLKTSNLILFEKNLKLMKAFETDRERYLEDMNRKNDENLRTGGTGDPSEVTEKSQSASSDRVTQNTNRVDEVNSTKSPLSQKSQEPCVPTEEQKRIEQAIREFFYSSEEYLQTDFSLKRLCEIVGSNRLYVSSVINNRMGTTFHSLLNEYRINEAKIRLLDTEKYGSLTIEAIAESLGYKSRSNFTRNFKTCTGLTPSEFVAIAKASEKGI